VDTQAPRHLTLAHTLLEQLRGFQPPPLQRFKVPPHCRIAHSDKLSYVSVLCIESIVAEKRLVCWVFFGGPLETRTPDPLIKSQLLYQLS
jgi:hypothetical protein